MNEAAKLTRLNAIIPVFVSISDRNWAQFKQLEREFAGLHGVETWADVLNFRIMPALDGKAKTWLLVQKCSQGIRSVRKIS